MGSFFNDVLSFKHECAVYEIDPKRMRFLYNTQRFTTLEELSSFRPNWSSMPSHSNPPFPSLNR